MLTPNLPIGARPAQGTPPLEDAQPDAANGMEEEEEAEALEEEEEEEALDDDVHFESRMMDGCGAF